VGLYELMGKKLLWNRNYSEKYLVDRALNQLSFAEHGLLKIINDILWSQTDRPGYYIVDKSQGTWEELMADAKRYAHGSLRNTRRTHDRHVKALLRARALAQDRHGTIYSPFIVREIKLNKLREKQGKRGGNPSLTP
jgi:hypothetical protein